MTTSPIPAGVRERIRMMARDRSFDRLEREDLEAEAVLRCLELAAREEDAGPGRLFMAAKNRMADVARHNRLWRRYHWLGLSGDCNVDEENQLAMKGAHDRNLESVMERDALARILAELPPHYVQALHAFAEEGSAAGAAARLGITESAAKCLFYRARAKASAGGEAGV